MGYHDSKYGSTKIRDTRRYNLGVSWDYDDDETDLKQRRVMFLFTPDMERKDKHGGTDHDHIELNQEQAKILYEWLGEFIKEVEPWNE